MSDLIPGIINTAVDASSWTAINTPAGVGKFNKLVVRMRDSSSFCISDSADGTNYIGIGVEIEIDVNTPVGNPLFYIKGTSSTTTEILLRK